MEQEIVKFCMYGLATGIFFGFLSSCIYHIINSFFRWAIR